MMVFEFCLCWGLNFVDVCDSLRVFVEESSDCSSDILGRRLWESWFLFSSCCFRCCFCFVCLGESEWFGLVCFWVDVLRVIYWMLCVWRVGWLCFRWFVLWCLVCSCVVMDFCRSGLFCFNYCCCFDSLVVIWYCVGWFCDMVFLMLFWWLIVFWERVMCCRGSWCFIGCIRCCFFFVCWVGSWGFDWCFCFLLLCCEWWMFWLNVMWCLMCWDWLLCCGWWRVCIWGFCGCIFDWRCFNYCCGFVWCVVRWDCVWW